MQISGHRFGFLVAVNSIVFVGLSMLLLGSLFQMTRSDQSMRLGLLCLVMISFFGLIGLVQSRLPAIKMTREGRQSSVERSINRVRTTIGIWMNSSQKTPKAVAADINLLIKEEPKLPIQIRELLLRVREEGDKLEEEIMREVIYWDRSTNKVSSRAREELDTYLREAAL
ncbi:MAG: hypothetical protein KJ970_08980 [Candidatus Eisenbacteria bacterium]|uniref:Uncharacterized protein n=1 Tax=Eiseniibacteriota bacterium TaxID=2212470 RepID=A0A948RUD2_UNCEI|nr:hypothetical protein [Candidatus Eisenbacteria bacterium]MBU1948560.1 hypothetical protein [Candidatus Eisenbacteria bacterium]MBU2691050.1 hypothetical protein [Candidatus Eisenbacteria bacterium]